MLWLSGAARIAVKAAIMFQFGREQMIRAAVQIAENPGQKLFVDLNDAPIASKIEQLLKGPKFSLSHPASPSQAPSPYKKQRLNLNASPAFGGSPNPGRGRTFPGGRGSHTETGRGFRGRGSSRGAFSQRYLHQGTQHHRFDGNLLSQTGMDGTYPTEPNDTQSPLKWRVLLWDNKV